MEGGLEKAIGQPASGSNSTVVSKFMLFCKNGWVFGTRNRVGFPSSLRFFSYLSLLFPEVVASVYKYPKIFGISQSSAEKSALLTCESAMKVRGWRVIGI